MAFQLTSDIRQDVSADALQSGAVKTWSFTTLMKFLECPYQIYLKNVLRKKGAPRGEGANRGEKIHTYIEDYIKGETDTLPKAVKHCREHIKLLRTLYAKGLVSIEGDWGFNVNWESTGWMDKDIWARVKLDSLKFDDETRRSAVCDDWKTGKKYGNEAKHNRQGQIYAIASFLRYPELEHVEVNFRYVDIASDNILRALYSRERAMRLMPAWTNNAIEMTTCTEFKPKPTTYNCQFCDFNRPESEYQCPYGVENVR